MNYSIVLVTFNAAHVIAKCLASILKKAPGDTEILVVDNASTDNTRAILKQQFAIHIRLWQNQSNQGFASACNQAIRQSQGKYILILNPDTEIVSDDFFSEMLATLHRQKDVAALGVKILHPDGSPQPSCGCYPTVVNIILDRVPVMRTLVKTHLIRSANYYRQEQHPDWLTGACLLITRRAIEQVGLFDETFFMYGEDVDWCYRASKQGHKLVYTPNVVVVHHDLGKSRQREKNKYVYLRVSLYHFFKKHRTKEQVFFLQIILCMELLYSFFLAGCFYRGREQQAWMKAYQKLISALKS